MKIFERLKYDLLKIGKLTTTHRRMFQRLIIRGVGNHELLRAEVAYQTFNKITNFCSVDAYGKLGINLLLTYYHVINRGDKYLTFKVRIFNQAIEDIKYIGKQFKYFTTKHGVRIMAFGILFDMIRERTAWQMFGSKTN